MYARVQKISYLCSVKERDCKEAENEDSLSE